MANGRKWGLMDDSKQTDTCPFVVWSSQHVWRTWNWPLTAVDSNWPFTRSPHMSLGF